MVSAFLFSAMVQQTSPSLTYRNGNFEIKSADRTINVESEQDATMPIFPADRLTLSYSGKEISFDSRGIGVANNGKFAYSKLPDIATTTKLFSSKEIAETKKLIDAGKRQAGFTGLSGYEYVDDTLYLLLRWEDSSEKPWLEALVAYDMTAPTVQAKLIGKFEGFSYAKGIVDDKLENMEGGLAALARKGNDWGLSIYNLTTKKSIFRNFGPAATAVRMAPGAPVAVGLRATSYGSTVVSIADIASGKSRSVAEIRGAIKGIVEPNYLQWKKGDQSYITNLNTGAELKPAKDYSSVNTKMGLLVFWPSDAPRRATLYEPTSFRPISTWVNPNTPPATNPKPAPKKPVTPVKKPATPVVKKPVVKPATTKKPATTTKKPATTTKKPTTSKSAADKKKALTKAAIEKAKKKGTDSVRKTTKPTPKPAPRPTPTKTTKPKTPVTKKPTTTKKPATKKAPLKKPATITSIGKSKSTVKKTPVKPTPKPAPKKPVTKKPTTTKKAPTKKTTKPSTAHKVKVSVEPIKK